MYSNTQGIFCVIIQTVEYFPGTYFLLYQKFVYPVRSNDCRGWSIFILNSYEVWESQFGRQTSSFISSPKGLKPFVMLGFQSLSFAFQVFGQSWWFHTFHWQDIWLTVDTLQEEMPLQICVSWSLRHTCRKQSNELKIKTSKSFANGVKISN